MSLSQDQERETGRIAELEVRRYFDHYLADVFPRQVTAIREHTHLSIEKHNGDRGAHGGAERKVNKLLWGIAAIVALTGFAVTIKTLMGR
jgi:hypothetical protein